MQSKVRNWVTLILCVTIAIQFVTSDPLTPEKKPTRSSNDEGAATSAPDCPDELNDLEQGTTTFCTADSASQSDESGGGPAQNFVVRTTLGDVKGHHLHDLWPIRSFIDIPYGKFERFHEPTEPKPWDGVHDVSVHNKRCPQVENDLVVGDNDCLVLSVFTPIDVTEAYSVLFHVHDGNFLHGSGDFNIYGPEYLVPQGTVLVLTNYRLGPLGFMCLQDEIIPGNAALKDLTLALKWVKNNIRAFGGDPDRITVSAEGRAGSLAGLLTLSPKSNSLFNQVIIESGSVLATWAFDRNPLQKAYKLLQVITRDSYENDTTLLHEEEIKSIILAASNEQITFKPCVENTKEAFLEYTPWTILNSKNLKLNIKFIIGFANTAGLREATEETIERLAMLNANYERLLPKDLVFQNNATGRKDAANVIKIQYFNDHNITEETRQELALYYTDTSYVGPILREVRLLNKAGCQVYLYEFAFDGEFNHEKLALNSNLEGAARGDILGYVFVQDGQMPQIDTPEENVTKIWTKLWATFIQTGNPQTTELVWVPLSSSNETILTIGSEMRLETGVHPERMELWTQLYKHHFVEDNSGKLLVPERHVFLFITLIAITIAFKTPFLSFV